MRTASRIRTSASDAPGCLCRIPASASCLTARVNAAAWASRDAGDCERRSSWYRGAAAGVVSWGTGSVYLPPLRPSAQLAGAASATGGKGHEAMRALDGGAVDEAGARCPRGRGGHLGGLEDLPSGDVRPVDARGVDRDPTWGVRGPGEDDRGATPQRDLLHGSQALN